MEKIIFIPGLDDLDKRDEFKEAVQHLGMQVMTHVFGFQQKDKSLDNLKNDLIGAVDDAFADHSGVIVGESAGGVAAVWAMLERPDKISAVYNVCGALRQPRKSFLNILYNPRFDGHFDHMLELIEPSAITDERLVSVRGRLDGLVRRSAVEFGSSSVIDIPAIGHPSAISYALKHVVPPLLEKG